eukprot:580816-Pleurochrysis_carterae.AAC.1
MDYMLFGESSRAAVCVSSGARRLERGQLDAPRRVEVERALLRSQRGGGAPPMFARCGSMRRQRWSGGGCVVAAGCGGHMVGRKRRLMATGRRDALRKGLDGVGVCGGLRLREGVGVYE